ncbi:uncharacterized protein FIBRA_01422 [Fibroporia radiculosa]|uniref:Uncharacterized protein n=1 Tax=Fibroporia radiculosa TaxID=599839 RepID=J4H140_9APHY|nr:uncharacterized protein FIBRA_01422 [Fibroporia radiculosa]CCL99404.1 predicted protein [Fibroporia radiculosa]
MSTTTPRPRPPAKARRIPSMQVPRFPPPPYALSLDQIVLDATSSASTNQDGSTAPDDFPLSSPTREADEWMNEKSREELSGLLLKADEIIKSRESELSVTTALCKSLYHDNVALKNKHESLLSRLPSSAASTTPVSPIIAPSFPLLSPQYSELDLSRSSDHLPEPFAVPRIRHSRRISVTPSDLARLSDQNAELIDKLENLELESQQADQAGKRKLKKLEHEIQCLRDELEKTQLKEAELEQEQTRAAQNLSMEEAQRRKEEREERVRVFKEKTSSMPESESLSEQIRDFAPPSELSRSTSLKTPSSITVNNSLPERCPENCPPASEAVTPDEHPQYPTPLMSWGRSQSNAETAIIAQLLVKIRELEETNAQIKSEQLVTEDRLRSVQWDAESIRRVYDCLSDGSDIELEVVPDDGLDGSPTKDRRILSGGTIKFSSLRRTIHQDLSRLVDSEDADGFADGITPDMRSTTRDPGAPSKPSATHRMRKSVVGLFDTESQDSVPSVESLRAHAMFFPSSPMNYQPTLGDISTWSTAATDGEAPSSPAWSDALPTPTEAPGHGLGRTLGSELGSEFGDDWGTNAGNHHLRTTSLYDLSGMDLSRDASMSPSVSERPAFVFPVTDDIGPTEPGPCEDELMTDMEPSTPPRVTALQLNVEPPTPTPEKLQKPANARQYKLSQTVRSRTNRWIERRYSPSPSSEPPPRRPVAGTSVRRRSGLDSLTFFDEFDKQAPLISRTGRRGRIPTFPAEGDYETDEDDWDGRVDRSVQLRADTSGILNAEGGEQNGFTGLILGAWLWLQFFLVIIIFIWTMARRGPKNVLAEAERRRTRTGSITGPIM